MSSVSSAAHGNLKMDAIRPGDTANKIWTSFKFYFSYMYIIYSVSTTGKQKGRRLWDLKKGFIIFHIPVLTVYPDVNSQTNYKNA